MPWRLLPSTIEPDLFHFLFLFCPVSVLIGAFYGQQVRDIDDAIQELWRRRDMVDRAQIASLRAAAGLTQDAVSISPYSDDEECHVTLSRNEGKSLKFSLKGLPISKDQGKSYSKNVKQYKKIIKRKDMQVQSHRIVNLYQKSDLLPGEKSLQDDVISEKADNTNSERAEGGDILVCVSPVIGARNCPTDQVVEENIRNHDDKTSKSAQMSHTRIKSLDYEINQKLSCQSETWKGKKLVIHLGSRNRNVADTPKLENSSGHREQDSSTVLCIYALYLFCIRYFIWLNHSLRDPYFHSF